MMRAPKKILPVAFCILLASVNYGCKNNEEKARELYNKAITASREGRGDDAEKALQEIVEKYPTTQSAIEANKALAARNAIDDFSIKTKKETLETALQLYRLDNGIYPTTEQGIRALTHSPVSGNIPRRWRAGGYVENEAILDIVKYYESDGTTYKISFK